jgi:hypothetical protein
MSIIKPQKTNEKEKLKIEIDINTFHDIESYCKWAKINDINHFFEEASNFVLSKDSDWKKYKKSTI